MASDLLPVWIVGVSLGGALLMLYGLYRLLWNPQPRQPRAVQKARRR
jgi:predicted alpha/beta-fold hydrolase